MEKLISFLIELKIEPQRLYEVADKLLAEEKITQEEVAQLKEQFVVEEVDEEKQYEQLKAKLDERFGIKQE